MTPTASTLKLDYARIATPGLTSSSSSAWTRGFDRQVRALGAERWVSPLYLPAFEARQFLEKYAPLRIIAPAVTSGDDGSIVVSWRGGEIDLTIEFIPNDVPEVFIFDRRDQTNAYGPFDDNRDSTIAALQRIKRAS